ncbi:MAG: hypothetical protein ABSA02_12050 [Trebonia sp.]
MIAVVAGLVVGLAAVVLAVNVLASDANGAPSSGTLYVYGTR